jgi:hypothetical protein
MTEKKDRPDPKGVWLMNVKNGEVFGFHEKLAKRSDMTRYDGLLSEARAMAARLSQKIGNLNAPAISDDVIQEAAAGAVEDAKVESVSPNTKIAVIVGAIKRLDPGNEEHFTGAGLPRTTAIERLIGDDVTAEERDTAFDIVNSENG